MQAFDTTYRTSLRTEVDSRAFGSRKKEERKHRAHSKIAPGMRPPRYCLDTSFRLKTVAAPSDVPSTKG
jgi:hypothetical protein